MRITIGLSLAVVSVTTPGCGETNAEEPTTISNSTSNTPPNTSTPLQLPSPSAAEGSAPTSTQRATMSSPPAPSVTENILPNPSATPTPTAAPTQASTATATPDQNLAPSINAEPEFSLVGYGAATTGGSGGETVKVTSAAEFDSAASGSDKRVIVVMNKIAWGGEIGPNKTILGHEDKGEITGGTLRLGDNTIVRNLKIYGGKKGADLIGIYGNKNIWIDHCEIYNHFGDLNGDGKIDTVGDDPGGDIDMYDGIIDITGSSGDITISWSKIHDGFKAMLKSASGDITYHHNEFYNSWERVPSFNGGNGHLFNNYFHDIVQSAINVRKGAVARIEGNVFENVGNGSLDSATNFERGPIGTYYSPNGCWDVTDNTYIDSKGSQPTTSSCSFIPPYEYAAQLQPSSMLKETVQKWAGTGKLALPPETGN